MGSLYVGQVVRLGPESSIEVSDGSVPATKDGGIYVAKPLIVSRAILFTREDDELYDRLYDSPPYPIAGVNSNYDCLSSDFVVHMPCDLSPVLDHFNLKVPTNPKEAWRIARTLFCNCFPEINCEVFGISQTLPPEPFIDYSFNTDYMGYMSPPSYVLEYQYQQYLDLLKNKPCVEAALDPYYYDVLMTFCNRGPILLSFVPKSFEQKRCRQKMEQSANAQDAWGKCRRLMRGDYYRIPRRR